jgi:hypothetical protein
MMPTLGAVGSEFFRFGNLNRMELFYVGVSGKGYFALSVII